MEELQSQVLAKVGELLQRCNHSGSVKMHMVQYGPEVKQ